MQNGPLVNLKHQIELDCFTLSSAFDFNRKQVSFCLVTEIITRSQKISSFTLLSFLSSSLQSFPIAQINSPEKEFYREIIAAPPQLDKALLIIHSFKGIYHKSYQTLFLLDLPYENIER